MKRFYCTVCKKVRRARRLPTNTRTPKAEKPTDRTGVCAWHAYESISTYRKVVR